MKLSAKVKRKARKMREKRLKQYYDGSVYEGREMTIKGGSPQEDAMASKWNGISYWNGNVYYEGIVLAKIKYSEDGRHYIIASDLGMKYAKIGVLAYDGSTSIFAKTNQFVANSYNQNLVKLLIEKANESPILRREKKNIKLASNGLLEILV